ncbi:uncharacterized protein EAE98_010065 [Botrytis deweyae]|uniref:Uncharacterized protein n=1 Tax=Botrytis deweyae TaxID=2478750 RepID=A0ABQ7I9P4_9HELO|nr:uncharacterized protein EAE98_010065 [Botrytis deweyae]KAF7917649.1 hypothetical protein EAE98_010065 [Botrytis deweyae]
MNNNSSGGGAVSNVQRFPWSENQYADITILRPELAGIRGSNVPIQTHQIAQWSGSTATITLANKWVQNCINSHERYSLYIIQDDGDDWLKESALMGNVYGGFSLNIAATGARNGNDGLFFKRDLNLVRTVDLMTQVEDQKNCFGANDSKRDNLRLAWVEYLAGIWKEHLPHALVWSVDDKDGTGPLPLRGPSWSWASRNGPIKHDRIYSFVTTPYDDRPSPWEADGFKVLDVQVRTTTPDLDGHCLGRTMRIECVNLLNGTETSGGKIFSRNKLGNPKPFHEGSSNIQCRPPPFSPPIPGAHDCEEGLIIAPVASKKGVFTRVGIYQVPAYGGTLQGFENLRNKGELSFENKLSLYKGVSGVNKAGHQTYIITLV